MTEKELVEKLWSRYTYYSTHHPGQNDMKTYYSIDSSSFFLMRDDALDREVADKFGPDWVWSATTISGVTNIYIYKF